jgi:hypothetical protein
MTDDKDLLDTVFDTLPDAPKIIARQLRLMAAAESQYEIFAFVSPWIKNIWNAAADVIEHYERQKLH